MNIKPNSNFTFVHIPYFSSPFNFSSSYVSLATVKRHLRLTHSEAHFRPGFATTTSAAVTMSTLYVFCISFGFTDTYLWHTARRDGSCFDHGPVVQNLTLARRSNVMIVSVSSAPPTRGTALLRSAQRLAGNSMYPLHAVFN